jgi:hypothetical protein
MEAIPRDEAEYNAPLPQFLDGKHLVVAVADPQNMHSLDGLRST